MTDFDDGHRSNNRFAFTSIKYWQETKLLKPIAVAIIDVLGFSLPMIFLFLPVRHYIFEKRKEKVNKMTEKYSKQNSIK